ncbi:Cullin-4B [Coprinopsis cinerea okayama7|uniref:Cullin-4B n=1 Tax=Coprinopsis cinerea (strain Okayama-7 / 130 / ATCC MYA-4618 / FGSC 9003) TaxID=240176 RepID=A8MZZ1_COPC7|nr:Cullin-4B [Coprinopsis cinerea okayama7\|eukprot:XP_001828306.2 Cullin-4B [Coprinopsis cinerea okayama7\
MALVASLLELPKTSNGLETFGIGIQDNSNDGSASPRRKIARLDADSDIASRSKTKTTPSGPFVIRIIGEDIASKDQAEIRRGLLGSVNRCVRHILTVGQDATALPMSYEKIYQDCRSIVTVHSAGSELYDYVKLDLEQAMSKLASHLLTFDAQEKVKWLSFFAQNLKWFDGRITLLQSLLTYLDQVYVANHSLTKTTIHDLAYGLFADRIFSNPDIRDRLLSGLSSWLKYERDNVTRAEERPQIAELIKYLINHNQYRTFEEHYLEVTQFYYRRESKAKVESMRDNPKGFFNLIESRIKQEIERSRELLQVGTWSIALETTETALLDGRVDFLSTSLVPLLLGESDIDTLGALYSRLNRVDALKPLAQAFKEYVQGEVKTIVTDTERDSEMVERLLDLNRLAHKAIDQAFVKVSQPSQKPSTSATPVEPEKKPDQEFIYAMEDAFNRGFRFRRNKPAEMIAKYLDKQLRKGQKGMKDAEFQAELSRVLPLYRFTEDKDVFRTFYHRMLSKRLLLGKSASTDIEKWMLKQLKDKYDPEFGTAEDMFKDLNLSRDLVEGFHRKNDNPESLKLNVMVLQQSVWPFSRPQTDVDLPVEMQDQLIKFTEYYKDQHQGRTLHWDPALGTVSLRASFKAGVKELSVSLYQAIILLLFNDQDDIPFKDIAEQTRIEDAELRRTLQSLACGKKRVLRKVPPGRDVEDGDVFKFNADFTDPHHRVHINTIQAKVSAEESKRTNISIESDRIHTIDAAIVRIMKAKKELNYEQLKVATIDAVKNHFVPSVDLIKKSIDSLVDRDYLTRNEEDMSKFVYVA